MEINHLEGKTFDNYHTCYIEQATYVIALARTNWIRTLAWTARLTLLASLITCFHES